MSKQKFNPRLAVLLVFIIVVGSMRIPNAANVTPWAFISPIGAIALFGGAYLKGWKAFVFPLLSVLICDLIIGLVVFDGRYGIIYGGWYWIYSIFILIICLGRWILSKVTVTRFVIASVSAALTHWLLADLTVWIGGGVDLRTMTPLSRDIDGLIQCYVQGFPFMKNFLIGTIAYGGVMFGVFELAKRYNPALRISVSDNK